MKDQGNGIDLVDVISSDELIEIDIDMLEASLDQFISDDFLKDIPMLGLVYKGIKLIGSLGNFFSYKKILRFLFELKDISKTKRTAFVEKIEKEGFEKTGEKLLFIIDRLDDYDKATILGKLYAAVINENIHYNDFLYLAHIIDKVYIGNLRSLDPKLNSEEKEYYSDKLNDVPDNGKIDLYQSGLLDMEIKDNRGREEYERKNIGNTPQYPPTIKYKENKYCEMLICYGF